MWIFFETYPFYSSQKHYIIYDCAPCVVHTGVFTKAKTACGGNKKACGTRAQAPLFFAGTAHPKKGLAFFDSAPQK